MAFLDTFRAFLKPSSVANGPSSGLHHYTRQNGLEKSRIHLRLDPDGSGTLIVNANSVMHLNPTAAFMAWLILEGKTEEERISALRSRYSVSRKQAQSDLSSFLLFLIQCPKTPANYRILFDNMY